MVLKLEALPRVLATSWWQDREQAAVQSVAPGLTAKVSQAERVASLRAREREAFLRYYADIAAAIKARGRK
jgi:hypothetical protein